MATWTQRSRTTGSTTTIRLASCVALLMLAGCNDAQTGAVLGAGGGAGLGAIIGHQSGHGGEGALIGAGAGALIGYIVGNESDKAKQQEQQRQQRGTYDSRAY